MIICSMFTFRIIKKIDIYNVITVLYLLIEKFKCIKCIRPKVKIERPVNFGHAPPWRTPSHSIDRPLFTNTFNRDDVKLNLGGLTLTRSIEKVDAENNRPINDAVD